MQNDVLYNKIITEVKEMIEESGGGGGGGGSSVFFVSDPGWDYGARTAETAQDILDAYLRGDVVIFISVYEGDSYTRNDYSNLVHIQYQSYQDGTYSYVANFGEYELMGDDPDHGLFYPD